MTRRSARLRNWADIARKRAEEVQAPNEAAQLMELAEDLDELTQIYDAARRSMGARWNLAGKQQAKRATAAASGQYARACGPAARQRRSRSTPPI